MIRLSPQATTQLTALPRDHQVSIGRALERMQQDPLPGERPTLEGGEDGKGGTASASAGIASFLYLSIGQIVEISAILLRTEGTYC